MVDDPPRRALVDDGAEPQLVRLAAEVRLATGRYRCRIKVKAGRVVFGPDDDNEWPSRAVYEADGKTIVYADDPHPVPGAGVVESSRLC